MPELVHAHAIVLAGTMAPSSLTGRQELGSHTLCRPPYLIHLAMDHTQCVQGPPEPKEQHGIIPNAFHHIFDTVGSPRLWLHTVTRGWLQVAAGGAKEFLVRASYLEIYNEEIRDLLGQVTISTAKPTQS